MTITITLYTADWCQPCKAYKPKLQALAQQLGAQLIVEDVDNAPNDVKSVPTTIITHSEDRMVFAGADKLEAIKTTIAEFNAQHP